MADNLKLDMSDVPEDVRNTCGVEPGDVYTKAGHGPGFWVVVSVRGNSAYVLAFNLDGEVTGAQSYTVDYFAAREHRFVGKVEVPRFQVEWVHKRVMR